MSEIERLFQVAVKRLSRRERSLSEIQATLEASGGDPQSVEVVLKKLLDLRYLDEERMAMAIIRDQRLQSRGPRAAWMKLKKRGISGWSLGRVEDLWRSESVSPDQEEVLVARRWVYRRYRLLEEKGADGMKEKQRALGALLRRGYSFSVAQRALQTPSDQESDEGQDG